MVGSLQRGVRNAFRNSIRTGAVAAILGLSLGMVVVMLAARGAVDRRIMQVKANVGNTVTISPAGARGFLGGGEPLTTTQLSTVQLTAHVTSVDATIDAQLRSETDTNLKSATELGTLGGRGFRAFQAPGGSTGGTQAAPEFTNDQLANFTPPILAVGTNSKTSAGGMIGSNLKLSSGTMFDPVLDVNEAIIGKSLAEKNGLSVGSTFTAYGKEIKVVGVYDSGNQFGNNSVVFPLQTLQSLSGQTDQITSMTAHIDTVENLGAVTSMVTSKLGSAADVVSSEETVKDAITPLENIRTIATTSLIGALIASAIITLLTMLIIVRERRKEIAVLKAIGAGDGSIMMQFMFEAISLSMVGSLIGTVLGIFFSNPILKTLLASSRDTSGPTEMFQGPGRGAVRVAVGGFRAAQGAIENLQAVVDWHLIAYGIVAAIGIAIIGSVFPAWLIGKVRPAEVLRSE